MALWGCWGLRVVSWGEAEEAGAAEAGEGDVCVCAGTWWQLCPTAVGVGSESKEAVDWGGCLRKAQWVICWLQLQRGPWGLQPQVPIPAGICCLVPTFSPSVTEPRCVLLQCQKLKLAENWGISLGALTVLYWMGLTTLLLPWGPGTASWAHSSCAAVLLWGCPCAGLDLPLSCCCSPKPWKPFCAVGWLGCCWFCLGFVV